MTRRFALLAGLLACTGGRSLAVPEAESAGAILQEMRSFHEMGTVLMIAAHPDDENTNLIAYMSLGRSYRMGYLSVTRGDGGQNLLGPELGDELGVIRTQELLAARRIDGGRQFFTRAKDFGFSKSAADTLVKWDRRQVVADIVRVIREFRPDVVVNRFSTVPGGTHGHHTASAILGLEAFKLAGDPNAFPEQLAEGLTVWQPKRIMMNGGFGGRGGGDGGGAPRQVIRMSADPYDPILGESFGEIASHSRSMHKSQGLGGGGFGGRGGRGGAYSESFELIAGEPATKDIMDGVDVTWNRVSGGAGIDALSADLVAHFNPQNPSASVPAILDIRAKLASIPSDPVVDDHRRLLDRILQGCLGLNVETIAQRSEVVPGETLKLQHRVLVWCHGTPVKWTAIRYPSLGRTVDGPGELAAERQALSDQTPVVPADAGLTGPYWLREVGTEGMFRVDDARLIGRPESPPAFPVEFVFDVGGQTLTVPDEPVQLVSDPLKGESRRTIQVVPPVELAYADDLELFAPGATKPAVVEVTAATAGASGTLKLEAPAGWTVSPAETSFKFDKPGERTNFTFTITAPPRLDEASFVAAATVNGRVYRNGRKDIQYEHIPLQVLQPVARLKTVSLDIAIRGRNVGYIAGAGDDVGESVARMGYVVTPIGASDFTADQLKKFDAILVGVRAYNTRNDLAAHTAELFGYAEAGGTVIELYNRPESLQGRTVAPFPLSLSALRVTNNHCEMTFLDPADPVFNTPNKITKADFEGWVQERGSYFPSAWDGRFKPLLACNDNGEEPLKGSLLVARDGKGYFVYTGLSFFRQLPAGVPGAYRLFANLVSIGK